MFGRKPRLNSDKNVSTRQNVNMHITRTFCDDRRPVSHLMHLSKSEAGQLWGAWPGWVTALPADKNSTQERSRSSPRGTSPAILGGCPLRAPCRRRHRRRTFPRRRPPYIPSTPLQENQHHNASGDMKSLLMLCPEASTPKQFQELGHH